MNISMLMLLYKDCDLVAGISPECAHESWPHDKHTTLARKRPGAGRGRTTRRANHHGRIALGTHITVDKHDYEVVTCLG